MVRTLPGSSQAPRGGRLPDFLLVGAPKAGTTALHGALAGHPDLFLSGVKEPKYYLCGDSPPPAYRGPGDAHSNREWIWQRQRYLDLFAGAGDDQQAGESTPFYLYHRDARRRIAADLPRAKLVTVLRDPVDRAYSNWMHLWADGLEPCADVVEACAREAQRVDEGWAPFWHYRGLGHVRPPAGRPLRALPARAGAGAALPRPRRRAARHAQPGLPLPGGRRGRGHRDPVGQLQAVREPQRAHEDARSGGAGGAAAGQFLPPQAWRTASRPIIGQLHQRGNPERPRLTPEQGEALREPFLEDIALLEQVTGESYDDWRTHRAGDTFHTRQSQRTTAAG